MSTIPCFINATIEKIISITFEDIYPFIVQAYDRAENTVMLKISVYIRKGNIIFLRFISVAIEL